MRKFDCLSSDCPILGSHILEASAGTGKTFSIEHIFVRLLKEVELDQILAVTFTRAVARELKNRIRLNLEKAISFLQSGSSPWPYLQNMEDPKRAIQILSEAQSLFERSQIFTIHGFCYRMLKEFAFEANLGFSLTHPDQGEKIPKKLWRAAVQFLKEPIDPGLLCSEQMGLLLKKYDSLDELAKALFFKGSGIGDPFSHLWNEYQKILQSWEGDPIEEEKLKTDFHALSSQYKATIKGDFDSQVISLARSFLSADSLHFRNLLREKGSLFEYLAISNRKVKFTDPHFLHYPSFFSWAKEKIGPLVQQAVKQENILFTLRSAWQKIADPILVEEEWFDPDEILNRMRKAIEIKSFASCIRNKYKAVIVDEFQDTDPMQWDIFRSLFLESSSSLSAFYLVGDPKQSIYRFRKADVYTYFQAREFLGEEALYRLDTNFRSSKKLIGALNALFTRNWLPLPKLQQAIPSLPVLAGLDLTSPFSDEKGAIHFMIAEGANSLFEESFLPYTLSEIERLSPFVSSFGSFAILVKDRYQGQAALELCQARSIPAIAKSHLPLGKTFAFESLWELFKAIALPKDLASQRMVQLGPFHSFPLSCAKVLLEEEGLIPFFQTCFSFSFDSEFEKDLRQVAEEILVWQGRDGFSFEGLFRFLKELKQLDPFEEGRRRLEVDENAVQILTLHISKGLEFEVVFALGVGSRTPEAEEIDELDAEKLRQLYVAMTRAKQRLYVPVVFSEKLAAPGTLSPIELFTQTVESQEGPFLSFLENLSHRESVSFEKLSRPFKLSLPREIPARQNVLKPPCQAPFFSPSLLLSFTALAEEQQELEKIQPIFVSKPEFTAHTIPRGKETGIVIHRIFETLLSQEKPLRKELAVLQTLVAKEVLSSVLAPWKEVIVEMVWKTLVQPLQVGENTFSLIDLEPKNVQTEMEFVFSCPPHFVKGFIDLVFYFEKKYYIVDWKTNWLGPDESFYVSLDEAMTIHDYWLQAALYTEALRRHVKQFYTSPFNEIFGGAFYFFVRGAGVCHFMPDLKLIERVKDGS